MRWNCSPNVPLWNSAACSAAAARRAGILLPDAICSGFALGLPAAV